MKNNTTSDLENQLEIVAIPQATMDQLLKLKNNAAVVALYSFIYYTANWQNTNQPRATASFCMKKLGWGNRKYQAAKSALVGLGLIENVQYRNEKGLVTKWYVRVSKKLKRKTLEEKIYTPPVIQSDIEASRYVKIHPVDNNTTNAYSNNRLNAYNNNTSHNKEEKTDVKDSLSFSPSLVGSSQVRGPSRRRPAPSDGFVELQPYMGNTTIADVREIPDKASFSGFTWEKPKTLGGKTGFTPLTDLEKWELAWEKRIPLMVVQMKHKEVKNSLTAYPSFKNTYKMIGDFIDRDISRGFIDTNGDTAMIDASEEGLLQSHPFNKAFRDYVFSPLRN